MDIKLLVRAFWRHSRRSENSPGHGDSLAGFCGILVVARRGSVSFTCGGPRLRTPLATERIYVVHCPKRRPHRAAAIRRSPDERSAGLRPDHHDRHQSSTMERMSLSDDLLEARRWRGRAGDSQLTEQDSVIHRGLVSGDWLTSSKPIWTRSPNPIPCCRVVERPKTHPTGGDRPAIPTRASRSLTRGGPGATSPRPNQALAQQAGQGRLSASSPPNMA